MPEDVSISLTEFEALRKLIKTTKQFKATFES